MPISKISATEASRKFSDLLNRVEYRGESFLIERHGRVIGRFAPDLGSFTSDDLADLLDRLPKPDPEFWDDVAAARDKQGKLPEREW